MLRLGYRDNKKRQMVSFYTGGYLTYLTVGYNVQAYYSTETKTQLFNMTLEFLCLVYLLMKESTFQSLCIKPFKTDWFELLIAEL